MNKRHHRRKKCHSFTCQKILPQSKKLLRNHSVICVHLGLHTRWEDTTPAWETPQAHGGRAGERSGCQHHHWVSFLPLALVPHYLIPHWGLGPSLWCLYDLYQHPCRTQVIITSSERPSLSTLETAPLLLSRLLLFFIRLTDIILLVSYEQVGNLLSCSLYTYCRNTAWHKVGCSINTC